MVNEQAQIDLGCGPGHNIFPFGGLFIWLLWLFFIWLILSFIFRPIWNPIGPGGGIGF